MFKIGLNRALEDDDIYDVTDSMRSDYNTEIFAKCWELELKKKNPSIIRVIMKIHGFKVFFYGILYTVIETLAR